MKPFDTVSFIMAYESGEASEDEILEGFRELISSGMINHLQGSYGRMAAFLIAEGLL